MFIFSCGFPKKNYLKNLNRLNRLPISRYYGSENYHSSRENRERSRSRDRGNAEHNYRGDER